MSEKALQLIAKEKEERTGRLNLGNCGLTEWPEELFELTWLEELVVGDNWEWDEEKGVFNIALSFTLTFKVINRLNNVPQELSKLPKLRLLYLNDLGIKRIENLEYLKGLKKLDLSYNQIKEIENLEQLRNLLELDLRGNQISIIKNLDSLSTLKTLNLGHNKIQRIENLEGVTFLSVLNLWRNQIKQIVNLDKFFALKSLDLSSNQIQRIEHLDDLSALTSLNLSSNQIQRIEHLNKLPSLTSLDLSANQIKRIEHLDNLTELTSLVLSRNYILQIENLDKLTALTSLVLSKNQIQHIEQLDKLTSLTSLDLSNNNIERIEHLDKLIALTSLELSINRIELIENLDNLTALTELYLSNNRIQRIEHLDNLRALTSIYLIGNQIQKIEHLDNLTALTELYLSNNRIKRIEHLDKLRALTSLDLSNNQIESVENVSDKTLLILEHLEKLDLRNNPLERINQLKNWDNKSEILGYIKSLKKPGIPNTFLKLNIIGEGRIGKTQLIHFFEGKSFIQKEKDTYGTNTVTYSLPDSDYKATIWDFGGQSYHHGFHHLFIREKDFNLVLWRNKADKKPDYGYWLGTARAFSTNKDNGGKYLSPLWLVQNVWTSTDYFEEQKDFTPDEVHYPDSKKLKNYQVGFEQVFCIDVKSLFANESSIENTFFLHRLHKAMKNHVNILGDVPEEFADIKRQLYSEDFTSSWKIDKSHFKIKYAPEMDIQLFTYLLSYLEFSGNIISFNEKEGKGLLKDYVLTSPPKLSDWMFKGVLEKIGIKEQNGVFTRKQLKEALQNEEDTQLFLDILDQYDLVFVKEEEQEKKYIMPQYLTNYNHSFKTTLLKLLPFTFSLCFEDFLHEGRFFNFMSLYGQYAIDDTAYWKYGILFQYKKTIEVLVYYDNKKRQIFVHIEDNKGKTKIAKELFDFFVFNKKPTTSQENAPASEEARGFEREKETKEKEQRDFAGINLVSLSTNENQYFDIQETHQNIVAKNYFGICTQTQKRIPLDYMAINLLGNEAGRKLRIFFSYSHKDETYRNELDIHFAMLKRNGRIETWYDRKIVAGSDWNEKIKHQLEMADIVLLMISANFLHSDYIWEQELGIVRERLDKNDGICVIPVFVEECDTEGLDLMRFQGGTKDDQGKLRWIASEPNRAKLYLENVENIKEAIKKMQ